MPAELPLLLNSAAHQLTICNSCRYCEGLCAVFPALERRNLFEQGDISQLANLCHDCRACFDACMYVPPHEFAVNLPQVLSAVRTEDYRGFVWPATTPRLLSGRIGVAALAVLSSLVVLLAAVTHTGWSGLVAHHETATSPYALIPYPVMLAIILAPTLYSVVILLLAARTYWRRVGGAPDHLSARAVLGALKDGLTLKYLRGGGADCYYPEGARPSAARRRLHTLVMYGFLACLLSTWSAGVMQDILSQQPPYAWLSVPVISGTLGGVALAAGSIGLLVLKRRSSPVTSFKAMNVKDYGLLVALAFLAVSGLAVLLTRTTGAFGPVFLAHLAAVGVCFGVVPYSKFPHLIYRYLALVRDRLEAL